MPVLKNLFRGMARGANRHREMTSKRGKKNFHPNYYRIQSTGYLIKTKFTNVKEMIPEIIVPDLKDFPLKAYVSYKSPNAPEEPLTPREIFQKCIAPKVMEDLKAGKYATSPSTSESSKGSQTPKSDS